MLKATIAYYEFLLKSLRLLKEMVEIENVPSALHPKSQEITNDLLSAVVDYIAIIEKEVIKSKFWDYVLSDEWALRLYYSEPDEENWDDEEEEDE